jgi:hypothetical protein
MSAGVTGAKMNRRPRQSRRERQHSEELQRHAGDGC